MCADDYTFMMSCDETNSCRLFLVGAAKNMREVILTRFSKEDMCSFNFRYISFWSWQRSLHKRGVFFHRLDREGCNVNPEKIPQITSEYSFSYPKESLKVADFLNHVVFLQKSMELIIERSESSFLTDPEIIGFPKNIDKVYQRSLFNLILFFLET